MLIGFNVGADQSVHITFPRQRLAGGICSAALAPTAIRNCAKIFAELVVNKEQGAFTMRDFASLQFEIWRRCRVEVLLALIIGPVFAWIDPFGATRSNFSSGVVFWTVLIACWFISLASVEMLMERSGALREAPRQLRTLAALLLSGLPMVVLTGFGLEAMHGWEPDLPEFLELYVEVILLGAIARVVCGYLIEEGGETVRQFSAHFAREPDIETAAPASRLPRLAQRLPVEIRGQVICLEMQDHYVRVHTDRGSAMLLLRLQDAIAELDVSAGRQVHRSWWVLDEAVESFDMVRRAGSIRLRNGLAVPVSRRYLQDVRTAWGH